MSDPARRLLRFVRTAKDVAPKADDRGNGGVEVAAVVDPAFVAAPGDPIVAVRDTAAEAWAARDLFGEVTQLLDDWADRTRVEEALAHEGVSLWYGMRLRMWWWLADRVLWLWIVDGLLRQHPNIEVLDVGGVDEAALHDVAALVADARGLELVGLRAEDTPPGAAEPATTPATTGPRPRRSPLRQFLTRLRMRVRPTARERERAGADARRRVVEQRRQAVAERVTALAADATGQILVLGDSHNRQRVGLGQGGVFVDPFLGPVVDALAGGGVPPIIVEQDLRVADDVAWERLAALGDRVLPIDAIDGGGGPPETELARTTAEANVAALHATSAPLEVDGVDLGPRATADVAGHVRSLASVHRERIGVRRLLERLRPAALLLVNEYGRPAWLAAARDVGVPVAAIQHGIIHRLHPGYVHHARPSTLPLPDRTYVFGDWERRLLVESSVYRPEEVVATGSPRLDLAAIEDSAGSASHGGRGISADSDAAALRRELSVADGHRLVVVTTTRTLLARRFGVAPLLTALLDRPLPNLHLVFKLHPRERDDGLYLRLVAAIGAARGIDVPPVSVVSDVDLYRLLRAADAHVGIYSTVLTEAVVAGTRNCVGGSSASADLLGYVAAGVATPVRNGAELLAALDAPPASAERRQAFIEDHFRSGNASARIAEDLAALAGRSGALVS